MEKEIQVKKSISGAFFWYQENEIFFLNKTFSLCGKVRYVSHSDNSW